MAEAYIDDEAIGAAPPRDVDDVSGTSAAQDPNLPLTGGLGWSVNGIAIAISVVAAPIIGVSLGSLQRAYGDPAPDEMWVAIGSVLFMLWVIGVTVWALLRISAWLSVHTFYTTTRVSVLAYGILRGPVRVLLLLTVIGLAAYGAFQLWFGMSTG